MSGPWGRATALRGGRFREQSDLSFEITHVLEALVDRRESQVGHRIERPQPLQHRQAHLVGANLEPDPAQLLFDLGGQRLDRVGLDRSVDRGAGDPGGDLRSIERVLLPGALDREQGQLLEPLVRGESAAAHETFAATPDRRVLLGEARIDHLVISGTAVWTTHDTTVTASTARRS